MKLYNYELWKLCDWPHQAERCAVIASGVKKKQLHACNRLNIKIFEIIIINNTHKPLNVFTLY